MLNNMDIPMQVRDQGFSLPKAYKRVAELSLVRLDPWYFLTADESQHLFEGLSSRYKNKMLLPFARRQDCDDVACFMVRGHYQQGTVIIIHDYATPGYEVDAIYQSFWDWFRDAVNEMINWSETDS